MDDRLAANSLPLAETEHCHVRLSRDRRWPWVLVIPKRSAINELHDCSEEERQDVIATANRISALMKSQLNCTSVNIAMLGNVVSQLHCHVVARFEGDPNWPAPIWGFGEAEPRADDNLPDFARWIQAELANPHP